ncbi:hypothetical protein [Burkholderia sp. Ax-1724]|uniref:hypothetical protein n=1 Tax=Burkholderia sp. Ax-1724 TaxID=2608336 RepID=UPI00141DDFB2|nr:hypothetical protein [Burkholderia sp. Ax-1724]
MVHALPLLQQALDSPPFGTSQPLKDDKFMDTHLMIGVAVMFGLIGIAASRDLLRRMREQQPQLVPVEIEPQDAQRQRREH